MEIRIKNKIYKNDYSNFEYYDDLLKLQKLMEELGFPKIDLEEIETMWDTISDRYYCAGWLCIPSSKEELITYLEKIEV